MQQLPERYALPECQATLTRAPHDTCTHLSAVWPLQLHLEWSGCSSHGHHRLHWRYSVLQNLHRQTALWNTNKGQCGNISTITGMLLHYKQSLIGYAFGPGLKHRRVKPVPIECIHYPRSTKPALERALSAKQRKTWFCFSLQNEDPQAFTCHLTSYPMT
jgi:hypothetical protein